MNVLVPAGPQAAHIAALWWLTLALCALVFIAVLGVLAWGLWRAPRGDLLTPPEATPAPDAEQRLRRRVTAAVAISTILLIGLLVASVATDRALAQLSLADAVHIRVTAHQWWWDVVYDDPEPERMFIKHRVTDPEVIRDWCQNIDLHRNLPLLALIDGKIIGDVTLHQQLGGWKRHVGRVSVLVLPQFRGRGLARALVTEIVGLARSLGLEKVEAEFIGEQEAAIKMFALLGFSNLLRLENYVKDMQAITHDYVLMGLNLKTDEEYAGME